MKDMHSGWYLVFTKSNHENIAKINLERQGFHIYLPFLQQHKHQRSLYRVVTEPLFPRYLFIHLQPEIDDWSKVRSTRGCVALVRFGTLPARVPDTLVNQLKQSDIARQIQNPSNTPDFKAGDHVQVIAGILANYEGIVALKNTQQRITLLLNIAEGHTRYVSLSVNQVKTVNNY